MRWWRKKARRHEGTKARSDEEARRLAADVELERDIAQIRVCLDQNLSAIREVLDSWPAEQRIEYAACLCSAASHEGNSQAQRLAALMQYTTMQHVALVGLELRALGIGQ